MNRKQTLTYSSLAQFRDCRTKYRLRHVDQLVPVEKPEYLSFGSTIHEMLEYWYNVGCIQRPKTDSVERYALAVAMMTGYVRHYDAEDFEIVATEKTFRGPIVNPKTGRTSRSFEFAGKIDALVRREDGCYLMEHKTTSQINGGYLEKLWTDFQTILYAHYIEKTEGIPIKGIIYNVLVKAKLHQGQGETGEEYEDRKAALIAKSKTGKSNAKRRMPESDEDFQARLCEKYTDPDMFYREILYISHEQTQMVLRDLWELTQQMLDCQRRKAWYRNTAQCFHWGRACGYYPLCRSSENPNVRDNLYRHEAPHSELIEKTEPEPLPF